MTVYWKWSLRLFLYRSGKKCHLFFKLIWQLLWKQFYLQSDAFPLPLLLSIDAQGVLWYLCEYVNSCWCAGVVHNNSVTAVTLSVQPLLSVDSVLHHHGAGGLKFQYLFLKHTRTHTHALACPVFIYLLRQDKGVVIAHFILSDHVVQTKYTFLVDFVIDFFICWLKWHKTFLPRK